MPNELNRLSGIDLIDRIQEIATRIRKRIPVCKTEEATKMSMVVPFIEKILGWDPYDPHQVVPEFTADVGTKRGEKVDYAILVDDAPVMLIETKKAGTPINQVQTNQLHRYFGCTTARFGIVTNGSTYRFHADLARTNVMDLKPFFEFDLLDFTDSDVDELRRFTRAQFNSEDNISAALDLKYTREIGELLSRDWAHPSDDFVRYVIDHVYDGVKTKRVLDQFRDVVKTALHAFITGEVNRRLQSAMIDKEEPAERVDEITTGADPSESESQDEGDAAPRRRVRRRMNVRIGNWSQTFPNIRDAITALFDRLARDHPGFLERCSRHPGFWGRKIQYLARSLDEMFDESSSQPEEQKRDATRQLAGGWYLYVQHPHAAHLRLAKSACEANGLRYGTDVEITYPEETSEDQAEGEPTWIVSDSSWTASDD